MDLKNMCIACLATDTRLHDMYRYGLVEVYEDITSIQITADDSNYQHYLCGICSTQLLKCVSFKEKCQRAQRLMNNLGSIPVQEEDRETYNLQYPWVIQSINTLSIPPRVDCIKEEFTVVPAYIETTEEYNDSASMLETISEIEVKHESEIENINEVTIEDYYEEPIDNEHIIEDQVQLYDENITGDQNQILEDNNINEEQPILFEDDIEVIHISKEDQIAEVHKRKESKNYKSSLYKCDKCFKGFMTDVTFANHMVRHDECSGAYECEVCGLRRATPSQLRLHRLIAHRRHFRCVHCGHRTRSVHSAREHRTTHTGLEPGMGSIYSCEPCGKEFHASTSYLSHMRLRHPTQDRCPICHKRFLGANGLKMHIKKAHWNFKDDLTEYICKDCCVVFTSEDALDRHLAVVSETGCQDLKSCSECGFGFDTDALLQEHIDTVHAHDETVNCDTCNKRYPHKRALAKHIQRCHGAGDSRTGKANDIEYICEICGTKCSSATTLMNHQRTHTGEKPYQCPDCPKKFRVPQGLQIHIRTHTNERPFQCRDCPKAFKNKAALNRHNRVHTGDRPYTCSHCFKSFSQSNSMKLHVLTVHLKLPAPYKSKRRHHDT